MKDLKLQLYQKCVEFIESRINASTKAMNAAQEAANEESKSSAGDKYETTRALMQIERDKNAGQLSEALKLKKVIGGLKPNVAHTKGGLGSMMVTNQEVFYLTISIGLIEVGKQKCYVISPVSPIGQVLTGKEKGDVFMFNSKEYTIINIF